MTDDEFFAGCHLPDHLIAAARRYLEIGRQPMYHARVGQSLDLEELAMLYEAAFAPVFGVTRNLRRDLARFSEALVCAATLTVIALPESSEDQAELALFTGGAKHRALCSSASRWLESQGRSWSADPGPVSYGNGCRADVATLDGKTFVEVGGTEARKLTDAICYGLEVLLVPYGYHRQGFLISPHDGHKAFYERTRREDLERAFAAFEQRAKKRNTQP